MLRQLMRMIARNILRSRTRLAITVLGCLVAAFVTAFFLSAAHSLAGVTDTAKKDANIAVRQRDRY